jgi:Protein of unknown function (DUF3306)
MNDTENFIARWSRRKRDAGDEKAQPEDKKTADEASLKSPQPGAASPPVPEFDPASLPPIESIEAGSDISAFMRSGVPSALRHAALRRAWSADPAIRDFVGLNENFWDAAGPEGISGFGELDRNLDVKRMVSELFGENASEAPKADSSDNSPAPAAVSQGGIEETSRSIEETSRSDERPDVDHPRHTEIAATQNQPAPERSERKPVRRHGGALPE